MSSVSKPQLPSHRPFCGTSSFSNLGFPSYLTSITFFPPPSKVQFRFRTRFPVYKKTKVGIRNFISCGPSISYRVFGDGRSDSPINDLILLKFVHLSTPVSTPSGFCVLFFSFTTDTLSRVSKQVCKLKSGRK